MSIISSAAYAASRQLQSQSISVKKSHLLEIMAALLGYRTYAALTVYEDDSHQEYLLGDAEILVLNQSMGLERARELRLGLPGSTVDIVVHVCIEGIEQSVSTAQIFSDMDDFHDYIDRFMAERIYDDDDVAGAMAESNAIFDDYPDMKRSFSVSGDIWKSVDSWSIADSGSLVGDYDPEGDRMFNGHTLLCGCRLNYQKAGRAGLVFLDSEASAQADDSWRDLDTEDELSRFVWRPELPTQ